MLSPSEFNNAVPKFTNGNYANNPVDPQYIEEPTLQDYNRGVEPLETLPAQWWNWLCNQFTSRFNKINTYVKNIFDEITQLLSLLNISPDGTESAITTGQLKNFFKELYPTYVSDKLELGTTYVPQTRTVNGHALTGNVTVTKSDVGLGNVDNTSDVDKPVSTAQATAISTAIGALDVASIGGDDKYISAISETDGIISATAKSASIAVIAGDNAPVSGGAVADILSSLPTDAVLHYSFDDLPDYPDGTATYKKDNDWLNDDDWYSDNRNTTFSITNGIAKWTTTNTSYVQLAKSTELISGKVFIVKFRCSKTNVTCRAIGLYSNTFPTITQITYTGGWAILMGLIPSTYSPKLILVFDLNEIGASVEISQIYIGDGSYSTPVIDNTNGKWNAINTGSIICKGVSGKAIKSFNNQYAPIKNDAFKMLPPYSFACWIKIKDYRENQCIIDGRDDNAGGDEGLIFRENKSIEVGASDGPFVSTSENTVSINEWAHYTVVTTIEGNDIRYKIFVNGVLEKNQAVNNTNTGFKRLSVNGRRTDVSMEKAEREVDDFLFFDRALTEKEVLALYYNKANTPKYYDLDDYKFANGDTAPTANSNNFVQSKTLYDFFGGNTSAQSWLGKVFGWALGKNWTQATGYSTTETISCIYYANETWVVGGSSQGMWWSTDGKSWTQVTGSIADKRILTLYYANGIWIAGTLSNGLWWSTDGKSWTQGTGNNTSYTVLCVRYANGIWVAGTQSQGFWWSTDGKSWTQGNNTTAVVYDVYFGDGIWVSACSGTLRWSTDGKNWTNGTVGKTVNPRVVYFADNVWKAASTAGILTSTDGKDWTVEKDNGNFTDIYYANGVWVAVSIHTGAWIKKNTSSWTQTDLTIPSVSVYYANNIWVVSSANRGFWWSTNGETWIHSNVSDYIEGGITPAYRVKTVYYGDGTWIAGSLSRAGLWWSSYENAGLK